jgi:hypothetical protein
MQEPNLFLLFVKPLNDLGCTYMVTGSVAAMLYGEARLTHDIDLVLDLKLSHVPRIATLFPESDFYFPPEEVIRIEMARSRRGHFNLIHHDSGFKADVYLSGEDPLQAWGLARTRRFSIAGVEVSLAPPEYVILKKMLFYKEGNSEKHIRDIEAMLRTSPTQISLEELSPWISRLELGAIWERIGQTTRHS